MALYYKKVGRPRVKSLIIILILEVEIMRHVVRLKKGRFIQNDEKFIQNDEGKSEGKSLFMSSNSMCENNNRIAHLIEI